MAKPKAGEELVRARLTMQWLDQYFEDHEGFPRPDWKRIYDVADVECRDANPNEFWCEIAKSWVGRLLDQLPETYGIKESDSCNTFTYTSMAKRRHCRRNSGFAYPVGTTAYG